MRRPPGWVIFTTGNKVYRVKPGGQQQRVFELEDRSWPRVAPAGQCGDSQNGRIGAGVDSEGEPDRSDERAGDDVRILFRLRASAVNSRPPSAALFHIELHPRVKWRRRDSNPHLRKPARCPRRVRADAGCADPGPQRLPRSPARHSAHSPRSSRPCRNLSGRPSGSTATPPGRHPAGLGRQPAPQGLHQPPGHIRALHGRPAGSKGGRKVCVRSANVLRPPIVTNRSLKEGALRDLALVLRSSSQNAGHKKSPSGHLLQVPGRAFEAGSPTSWAESLLSGPPDRRVVAGLITVPRHQGRNDGPREGGLREANQSLAATFS